MLIDWVTVGAQIINFLILVWLLNRFLFQPVLIALDEREQKISSQLDDAKKQKQMAEDELKNLLQEKELFKRERTSLMAQAMNEIKVEKEQLLNEARKEGEAFREHIRSSVQQEQKKLYDEIARNVEEEVFMVSKKVLKDLSGAEIENQIVNSFFCRLRAFPEKEKMLMNQSKADVLKIVSSFPLTTQQKETMEQRMHEFFPSHIPLRYETSSDLICGIELIAEGFKVTWNISGYLKEYLKHCEQQTIV